MHYFNLLYYILGYVRIELRGEGVEKFLNLAIKQGIVFWDVKRKHNYMELKVPLRGFSNLKQIARKTGCEFKIITKKGVPFFLNKINRRKGFVIGTIIFVVTLYYLSTFIWFIQVDGNDEISGEEVLEMAEKHGLKPGIKKEGIGNISRLAELITAEDDRLNWVGIEIEGTRALIEVVEGDLPEDKYQGYGDIVAVEEGEVEKVITLSGFSLVSKGDEVNKDEILIAGRIVPTKIEEEKPELDWDDLKEYPKVEAKGFVYGIMFFEDKVDIPMEEEVERRTTDKVVRRGVKIGDETFFLDLKEVPYVEYDVEKINTTELPGDFRSPITMVRKIYYKTETEKIRLTEAEAKERAREVLWEKLAQKMPPNSKIDTKEYEDLGTKDDKLTKTLKLEVEGNMGKLNSF